MRQILAKSDRRGSKALSLFEHTHQVLLAAVRIAEALDMDVRLARMGAALHDLGKAHPYFQSRIYGEKIEAHEEVVHRHELSSLAFLPLFDQADWDALIEMVVAHHKSIYNDVKNRGILDLDKANRNGWIENHLEGWDTWSAGGLDVLQMLVAGNELDIVVKAIPEQDAKDALQYALSYCKKRNMDSDWSKRRGLLMAADHMASALQDKTATETEGLFEAPDLTAFDRGAHPLYHLTSRPTDDLRPHTLVVASTGAGKTDFLFCRCRGRVFYTLPFQASINAMFERVQAAIPNKKHVRFRHAMSKIVASTQSVEEKLLQDKVGASVKVLTPHQLAAIVFGTPGYESVMLDVQGCDVILDEIHTYSDQAQAMVLAIVEVLLMLNCRIHIGTATMPSVLYKELLVRLGGPEQVYEVSLTETELDDLNRHLVYKVPRQEDDELFPESCVSILEDAFAAGEKVLVICNTVDRAQKVYEYLSECFEDQIPETRRMIIHSRFRRQDRVDLERRLKEQMNAEPGSCLVVSTQVVEVSLDISFDRMITEAAPLDALVQRFGRINRVRKPRADRTLRPVHVLQPEPKALPYDKEIVLRSYEVLPDSGNVLEEKEIQGMLDTVYPDLVIRPISSHCIWKDGELETLSTLNHNRKSVLVEAMDIESATAILECDRDRYLDSKTPWDERTMMEIPISWKTIQYNRNRSGYVRLEFGTLPFVIPQKEADYKRVGLQLVEQPTII